MDTRRERARAPLPDIQRGAAGRKPKDWRCYSITEGLAAGVICLLEDRQGHLWIGTEAGPCRYDGARIASFSGDDGAPTRTVRAILQDRRGRIWFGTWAGVGCYRGGCFIGGPGADALQGLHVEAMEEDAAGAMWFGTWYDGLCRLKDGRIAWFTQAEGLAHNAVRALFCDRDGRIWAGTAGGGVSCLEDGRVVATYGTADGLADSHVLAIAQDQEGRLWFGTWRGGASCFNGQEFITYAKADGLCDNTVNALCVDRQGCLWFGTWGGGVSCLTADGFLTFTVQDGLLDNRVNKIIEYDEGLICLAHSQSGVTVIDRGTLQVLSDVPVTTGPFQDASGSLWFTSEYELCCLADGELRRRTFPDHVMTAMMDSRCRIWAATFGSGIFRYDSADAVWRDECARFTTQDGLPTNEVTALLETRDGSIWAAAGYEAHLCRLMDGRFEATPTRLYYILRMFEDSRGRIWLGSWEKGGLCCCERGELTYYTERDGLPCSWIKSLVEDDHRHIWIGTRQGLCRYDGERFVSYGQERGLPSALHQQSAKDASGNLWFGTMSVGIQRHDGRYFQCLTTDDALPSNSVSGFLPEPSGAMVIGTSRGMVRYHPTATAPRRTEIREVLADQPYPAPKEIALTTTQARMVTISYQGVSLATRRMRYRYILEGYDAEWRETWDSSATYQDLPAGEYVFTAIAITRDLTPSDEPAVLTLTIVPDPVEERLAMQAAKIDLMSEEIERHRRVYEQNRALLRLATGKAAASGDLKAALEEITEVAACTLEAAHVSVWTVGADAATPSCASQFDRLSGRHTTGDEWTVSDYQALANALAKHRVATAAEAYTDTQSGPLRADNREPPKVGNILFATLRFRGETAGAVAFTPVPAHREWTVEERNFAGSIADFVSLAFEESDYRAAMEALRLSRESDQQLQQKLLELHKLGNELSKSKGVDDLCRTAVELGRSRLGLDQLGIWFFSDEPYVLEGSFGTDNDGNIRDERGMRVAVTKDWLDDMIAVSQTTSRPRADILRTPNGEIVENGECATALLWAGEDVIGTVSISNLIHRRPISEEECQLLRLFASTVGHLCWQKRTEDALRRGGEAERRFKEKLLVLHEVSNELSKTESFDDLCRQAVEMGLARLGFERLGVWFTDAGRFMGSFGTDLDGRVMDERGTSYWIEDGQLTDGHTRQPHPNLDWVVKNVFAKPDAARPADKSRRFGYYRSESEDGVAAIAALWDGEESIGVVLADNLLEHKFIDDQQCELLALYASVLGHLCSRKRAEDALRGSRAMERRFREQLEVLLEVTNQLSKVESLDDLCRRAVELGRDCLGFDRLGIWLKSDKPNTFEGTFGTDEEGNLRDERGMYHSDKNWTVAVKPGEAPQPVRVTGVAFHDEKGNVIGEGDGALGWLWDGQNVIGLISTDNLLQKRPVTEQQCAVLGLFASSLAHLCSRKRAEQERRKMEAQMQHAQKLESLGLLAGGIAHDFNNLLVGILGNADLALGDLPPGSPARPRVEQVQNAALRAAELTNQMLAYSGKGQFVLDAVDLSELAREMIQLLRISISKKIVLNLEFASDLPAIEADPAQVRQVIMNLVTNAAEAIGNLEGVISIRTARFNADRAYLDSAFGPEDMPEGAYVCLEVTDTGSGMDAATIGRIFDPFYTTKFTGRGLGLAAVLGIVRAHHGTLKIDSSPGQGTSFTVLFPCAKTAPASSMAPPERLDLPVGGTILLVDDEDAVLRVAQTALTQSGFSVLVAHDGQEALDVFQSRADEITAVVLDVTMPRMDGEETFRALRLIRPDVRVLMSSGYSEQHAMAHFTGERLMGFIQKPYLSKALVEKLRQVLQ